MKEEITAYDKIPYKVIGERTLYIYVFYPEIRSLKMPAVLCIHGGGWERESAEIMFRHASFFAGLGFVGISVEYRLMTGEENLIICLEDCIDAAIYVGENADVLGIDIDALNAFGDSAGGYLACCLGSKKIVRSIRKDASTLVSKVIDLNGIVDLTGYWGYALRPRSGGGIADALEIDALKQVAYSPVYNISEGDAPVFIMHGLADSVVDVQDSERYHGALKNHGVDSEILLIPDVEHAFILFDYNYENSRVTEWLREVYLRLAK